MCTMLENDADIVAFAKLREPFVSHDKTVMGWPSPRMGLDSKIEWHFTVRSLDYSRGFPDAMLLCTAQGNWLASSTAEPSDPVFRALWDALKPTHVDPDTLVDMHVLGVARAIKERLDSANAPS